jgi:tetratricopeptide (TPR) repeat protein
VFEATVSEIEKLGPSEASLNALLSLWSAVQGSGLSNPPSLDRAIERLLARFPHRKDTTRYWFLVGENERAVESTDAAFASRGGRGAINNRFLYFLRSYLLVHLGRPQEAIAESEEGAALVRYPLSHSAADLLLCRGDVADALSDHTAALEHFLAGQRLLSRLSGYSSRETIRHTIRACDQLVCLGRFDEALEQLVLIDPALDVFGAMAPLAGAVRAASLAALGARDEARTAARQALSQLAPGWSFDGGPYRPRSVLARTLLDVGERQEGIEQASLALREVAIGACKIRTATRRRDFLDLALGVPAALALGAELGLPLPTADP